MNHCSCSHRRRRRRPQQQRRSSCDITMIPSIRRCHSSARACRHSRSEAALMSCWLLILVSLTHLPCTILGDKTIQQGQQQQRQDDDNDKYHDLFTVDQRQNRSTSTIKTSGKRYWSPTKDIYGNNQERWNTFPAFVLSHHTHHAILENDNNNNNDLAVDNKHKGQQKQHRYLKGTTYGSATGYDEFHMIGNRPQDYQQPQQQQDGEVYTYNVAYGIGDTRDGDGNTIYNMQDIQDPREKYQKSSKDEKSSKHDKGNNPGLGKNKPHPGPRPTPPIFPPTNPSQPTIPRPSSPVPVPTIFPPPQSAPVPSAPPQFLPVPSAPPQFLPVPVPSPTFRPPLQVPTRAPDGRPTTPIPQPPSNNDNICQQEPVRLEFLQFSAIPPALPVYENDPNAQDIGTRYIYNSDIRDSNTLDELIGSRSVGICTRTQQRIIDNNNNNNNNNPNFDGDDTNTLQLGGGYCTFTYKFRQENSSVDMTFEASGTILDSLGGILAITGGTQNFIGAYGEIELIPVNLNNSNGTTFERENGDIFLDPLFYLADAIIYLPCS